MYRHKVLGVVVVALTLTVLTSVASAGYTPPTTGLQAWYKSTDGVTTDEYGVSTWADQSGNGYTASRPSASYAPNYSTAMVGVNTIPVVSWEGLGSVGGVMNMPTISGASGWSGFSAVIVQNNSSYDKGATLFSTGSGASAGTRWALQTYNEPGATGGLGWVGTGSQIGLGPCDLPTGTWGYTAWSYDKSDWTMTNLATGSVYGTVPDGSFFTDAFNGRIGAEAAGVYPMTGNIAEVLVYDHALSAAETAALQSYIDGRYMTPIPEPSAIVLALLGAISLVAYAWRKRR